MSGSWLTAPVLTTSALATTLNPYGFDLLSFLYRTATVPRPDITEWQPLTLMTRYGLAYAAYVAVAIWGLLYSRKERPPALLAVLIVMIVLPLIAIRHASLSALGIAVLTGEHISDAWERAFAADREPTWPPSRIRVVATVLLLAARPVHRDPCHTSPASGEPAIGVAIPFAPSD
jgi:hypothetical protein